MATLEGRVAVISGASRGIGRAIAVSLAERGADVVVNYRRRADAAAAVAREVESLGRRALALRADVGVPEEAAALVTGAVESLGRLDILVNNAGVWRGSRIEDVGPDLLEALVATNLKSAFYLSGPAAVLMKERGWGRIVNISSVIGVTGFPGDTVYGSTKAGLIGFTKSLARELVRFNVTVNAVIPGFIETDMADEVDEETRARVARTIPMRRYGRPEDVGELVGFLCERGDYITGQLFTVDGGYTI